MQDLTDNRYSFFSTIEDVIPHIITIVDPVDFKLTYISRVQEGFSKDQVLGQPSVSFIVPEFQKPYLEVLNKVRRERTTEVWEVKGLSGEQESGTAWYKSTFKPLEDAEKNLLGILMISEDVSKEKMAGIELSNKQERLTSIINNTKDIILSIDSDLNITEFNSVLAGIVKNGYNKALKIGDAVFSIIHPDKHEHLRSIYLRVFENNQITDLEQFKLTDGRVIYFETSYNPIKDVTGRVVGISIFSKDITERILNEEKLKKALTEKERMLQEIHHRLKNNLAIVSSILQLQEINIKNGEAKEALNQSRQRIKSTALLHELLYQGDSLELVSLKTYLTRLFDAILSTIGTLEIQLSLKGDDLIVNSMKAVPLGLLFNELITNSFKHSFKAKNKGEICISINGNTLTYTDTESRFPDIIDFKNPTSTGLTLIHTFVEQLGGSIELKNDPLSTFIIILDTNAK